MKVYPSDLRDWSAELRASGKHVKPTHPYDQEAEDDWAWWMYMFFPVSWILRFFVQL
jgi:hypothetical protein